MDGRRNGIQGQTGFTLIEQILVLAIVATLMAVAVPPVSRVLSRAQLRTAQLDLIGALQHARQTAVMKNSNVILCPTIDHQHCRSDSRWESGWLLGTELKDNGDTVGVDKVIYIGPGFSRKLTIISNRPQLRFQPDGTASGSNLTLTLCERGANDSATTIFISNVGRVRSDVANTKQIQQCGGAN